jgi:hypothetical protein
MDLCVSMAGLGSGCSRCCRARGRIAGAGLGVSSGSGVEGGSDNRGMCSDVGVSVRGLYDGSGLAVDAILERGGSVMEEIDETLGSATEDSSSLVVVGMAGSDLCAVECESAGVRAGSLGDSTDETSETPSLIGVIVCLFWTPWGRRSSSCS